MAKNNFFLDKWFCVEIVIGWILVPMISRLESP
jgi:hypothetical protein